MAEGSIRQYESALAQELADGHARLRDLEAAALELNALGKLLAGGERLLAGGERDAIQIEALYCTAAVRYRRFFISSSRQSRDLIHALEPRQRQDHDLLLAAANQHLTHPLAAFAEVKVGVTLSSEDPETAEVSETVVVDRPPQLCSQEQVARYLALVQRVHSLHSESLALLRERVEEEARALPVELLLGLPEI